MVGAAATAAGFWVKEGHANSSKYGEVFVDIDRFVEQFMREMNSPGMTLVLADREGVQRVATYGYTELGVRRPLEADELFQIGSITKSFLALVLLQLREEGKLDLHKPIVEYLPWFRIQSSFAPITTHHLLTHTSGLPGAPEVFPSDPAQRHLAAYAPGERFHYNNMAYSLLGYLAWTLGRPRAARHLSRADLQAARHVAERARHRLPDARSHAEELPAVPERSPLPSTCRSVRSTVDHHHERRGLHRCSRARYGRVRADDRQSRPWTAAEPDFAGKLRAVLEAPHQGRGIRPQCKLWLRHRGRRARRQRAAATHRRHGVIHVGDASRHRGGHRRFRFGQRTAGISPECCREVCAAAHARSCRGQEVSAEAHAGF